MMQRPVLAVLLSICAGVATAAEPAPLAPYEGKSFTVSLPAGWAITPDANRGVIVARADPGRKDAAALLLVVSPSAPAASEEQLLDTIAGQFATGLTATRREAIEGGGHLMIADGRAGDLDVRLGVIAVVAGGTSIVCLAVARPREFEALGGLGLVTAVLGSIRAHAAPAPAPGPSVAAPPGKLEIPPPARPLRPADLAGDWKQGESTSITNYVSASTGAYAGYDSIATRESWAITARGAIKTEFFGVTSGRIGTRAVSEKHAGTISLSADGAVLQIQTEGGRRTKYVVRGWLDGPNGTVLKLNGPWYADIDPEILADPHKGWNLDSLWVRPPRR
jgi:hypothetical protein